VTDSTQSVAVKLIDSMAVGEEFAQKAVIWQAVPLRFF
jgi:hypothetical protein